MRKFLVLLMVGLVFIGCSKMSNVSVVKSLQKGSQICIIENPHVEEMVAEAIEDAVVKKGYSVQDVEQNCEISMRYNLTSIEDAYDIHYLMYLNVEIVQGDEVLGSAIYDQSKDDRGLLPAEIVADEIIGALLP